MTDTPKLYAAQLAAFSAALTGAVPALTATPAVAPAAGAPASPAGLPALAGARLALKAACRFAAAAADTPSPTDRAMVTAGAVAAIGTAGQLAAYAAFTSREEAIGLRQAIAEAGIIAIEALEVLGDGPFAGPASAAIRSVRSLMATAAADINEAIGRLPAVVVFETDRDVDAWLVANHLYGDRSADIEGGYRSIVSRNDPRHPARLPAGRIEALKRAT